jgi:hypothetical protein
MKIMKYNRPVAIKHPPLRRIKSKIVNRKSKIGN